jgi:hypothetical protein
MTTICLLHWNETEALERLQSLQSAGFTAYHSALAGPPLMRQLRENPPSAIVIDLTRLPSHGREVGAALRAAKATRFIPLIFAGGEAEKVARIRDLLPDAVFTTWEKIATALQFALANPPVNPVAPSSSMDAYAGQPLVKKLGIKAGMKVALMNEPADFRQTVGSLPENAHFQEDALAGCSLAIWFIRSRADLNQALQISTDADGLQSVWLAWPKKASGFSTDLTQPVVRETGLARGWVDYKICAIDAVWSGLLFTRRKKESAP